MNEPAVSSVDSVGRASPPRQRFPCGLALLSAAVLIATGLAWRWIDHGMPLPVQIVIDGARLPPPDAVALLPWPGKAALAAGIAVTAIALAMALLVALLALLAALLLMLLMVVALPLLLGAAVLLIVLSPLWVVAWLLWRAASVPRRSTTMAA